MSSRRTEVLRATQAAADILNRFPVGARSSFDIVGAVLALGIPLVFRPLKGLWGATITVDSESRGVIVTSNLDLHVQRFTLAHELGHLRLGHETRFDTTIDFAGRFAPNASPTEEIAANTFASEVLAPRALMLAAAKRHDWTTKALSQPPSIYQLSLRLGLSFQAACWALASHDVIATSTARTLQTQTVKELKSALAPSDLLTNAWANVWRITQGDSGLILEAGLDDIFALQLQDYASAGFLWELVDAGPECQVLGERPDEPVGDEDPLGQPVGRVLYLRFRTAGTHRLFFEHRRPWNRETLAHIDISIDNHGKEQAGFARREREIALLAAGP